MELMKSKALYPVIVMTALFLLLSGCDKNLGILDSQTKRTVENNVFTSTFPEIKLQIDRELKYLGKVLLDETTQERIGHSDYPGERSQEANAYLFAKIDQTNKMTRGVLIRTLVVHGDARFEATEVFFKPSTKILESSEMKILDTEYQYDLYTAPELFAPKEKNLLAGKKIPSCFLSKQLSSRSGFGNKSRIQILYFEDLTGTCGSQPCGTCLDSKDLTAEGKPLVKEFTDRSFASIRFMKTRTVEDSTSRYVDAEPTTKTPPTPTEKVQSAPVEKASPRPAPVEKVQPAPVEKVPTPVEKASPKPAPVEKVQPTPVEKATSVPAVKPPSGIEAGKTGATDSAEKRLEALKRLYERELISKEDYEKKKAEILKEL
jgi:hypothetical protein